MRCLRIRRSLRGLLIRTRRSQVCSGELFSRRREMFRTWGFAPQTAHTSSRLSRSRRMKQKKALRFTALTLRRNAWRPKWRRSRTCPMIQGNYADLPPAACEWIPQVISAVHSNTSASSIPARLPPGSQRWSTFLILCFRATKRRTIESWQPRRRRTACTWWWPTRYVHKVPCYGFLK